MTIPTPAQPPPSTLTDADRDEVRCALLDDRRRHLDRVAWLEAGGLEGFDDQAAVSALRSLLVDIDAALTRLELGTYGRCTACGHPIAAARLLALPHTTCCVDCG